MSTRFPLLPLLAAVFVICGTAGVVHQRRAAYLTTLHPRQPLATLPPKIPPSGIGVPKVPAGRLQAIRQQFSNLSGSGLEKLRAFESLSREELEALLLAEEPPWEGAEILPWKLKLFARFAELDAAAALRLADSAFPEPSMWLMATRPLLLRWLAQDPVGAAVWWRALPVSREPLSGSHNWREINAAMEEAVPDSAAWAEFTAALEAVPDQMPTDRQARRAAREAIDAARNQGRKFRSGPARGRMLAAILTKGRGTSELCGAPAMAASWAEEEPGQARAWLEGILARLPEASNLAPAMALQKLRNNYDGLPSDAVDFALWAHALHPAGCTPEWWAELIRSNAPNRSAVATALLQAVPAETDHDPAIIAWLENTEAPDPGTVGALLAQITDPAKRAAVESTLAAKAIAVGEPAQ